VAQILIIDCDTDICELIAWDLESLGHQVEIVNHADMGIARAQLRDINLAVISLDLFNIPAYELVAVLRSENPHLLTLLLLTELQDPDKLGVDDIIVKPFAIREVVTKVRQILRKNTTGSETAIIVSHIRLDAGVGLLHIGESPPLELEEKDKAVLQALMERPGEPSSTDELLCRVWGLDTDLDESAVQKSVSRINELMRNAGMPYDCIRSVFGIGYRFLSPEEVKSGVIAEEDEFFA
jgi:DNA-binding response OmpR family regulator